jgi:hypothetical protein
MWLGPFERRTAKAALVLCRSIWYCILLGLLTKAFESNTGAALALKFAYAILCCKRIFSSVSPLTSYLK